MKDLGGRQGASFHILCVGKEKAQNVYGQKMKRCIKKANKTATLLFLLIQGILFFYG